MNSPKHYDRDKVELLVIPNQTRKRDTPLMLFVFKPQQQPKGPTLIKIQKNILKHHPMDRKKTCGYNVTR